MPPSKEAIVKQIEHDRDFALCCLNRKLTDAPTIRRLVGEMKAQGFKNCLADLMITEGIIDTKVVRDIEGELAERKAKDGSKKINEDRRSTRRKANVDSSSTPLIPEFAFGEVLSERAGTLYKVRGRDSTQDECLRILPKELKNDAELKIKFRVAFNKIKTLQHPMLCGLGDLKENDHHLYYTTEFVDGPTLDDVLRQNRPFPGPVALGFVKVLSGVLDHAHQNGVIHRDLHPSALVFLPNRQMRFNDFGLERLVNDLLKLDEPESIRCFRSPEDLKSSAPNIADDLFGIGALLYFVVTGTRPPRATASGNVALPNLQKTAPHLPPDIISIITRLLLPRLARISSIPELTQALNKPMTRSYGRSRADEFLKKTKSEKSTPQNTPAVTENRADENDGAETIMLSFGSSPVPSENPNNQSFETAGKLWDADPGDTTIKDAISPAPASANPWDFNPNQAIAEAEHNLLETIRENAPPATLKGDATIRETFAMPALPGKVHTPPPTNRGPRAAAVPTDFDPNAATIRDLDVKQALQGPPPKMGGSFDFSAPMPSSKNFGPGTGPDAATLVTPYGRNPDAEETALPDSLPTLKAMQAAREAQVAGTDPFAETQLPLSDPNAETIVPAFPGSAKAPKFEDYQNYAMTPSESKKPRESDSGYDPHADTIPEGFDPHSQTLIDAPGPRGTGHFVSAPKQIGENFDPHAQTLVDPESNEDLPGYDPHAQTLVDADSTRDMPAYDPHAQTMPEPSPEPDFDPHAQTMVDPESNEDLPGYDPHAQTLIDGPRLSSNASTSNKAIENEGLAPTQDLEESAIDQHAQTMLDYDDVAPHDIPRSPTMPSAPANHSSKTADPQRPVDAVIPAKPTGTPRPKTDTEIDDEIHELPEKATDSGESDRFDPAAQTLVLDESSPRRPLAPKQASRARGEIVSYASQKFDDFQLMGKIGDQGLWEIYEAEQISTQNKVFVKVLQAPTLDEEIKAKLEREVHAFSRLSGVPSVDIVKVGRAKKGEIFLALEDSEVKSFDGNLAWGALKFERGAELLSGLIHGLSRAQGAHFVHGALSEKSIGLIQNKGSEHLVLMDVGFHHLFRQIKTEIPVVPEELIGYLSPEFREGRNVDHRADIYSLGIFAYRIFTGQFPFEDDGHDGPLQPMSELSPQFMPPTGLEDFCKKAIAEDPKRRFQSHDEMLGALRKIRRDYRSATQNSKHRKPKRRKGIILGLVLVCVVISIIAALFAFEIV